MRRRADGNDAAGARSAHAVNAHTKSEETCVQAGKNGSGSKIHSRRDGSGAKHRAGKEELGCWQTRR